MDAYQRVQMGLDAVEKLQKHSSRVDMCAGWLLKQIELNEPDLQAETYRLARQLRDSLDS